MKSIALLLVALFPLLAAATEDDYTVLIQDHRFQPETLTIPAGKKVRLIVDNRDAAPEEFDSHALNREKVIPGNARGTIYIGPLDPGSYPFIGEFHDATAKGMVVAR